jgi:hypothetical protein
MLMQALAYLIPPIKVLMLALSAMGISDVWGTEVSSYYFVKLTC